MKVVIRITVEHYANFVAACDTASPAHAILTDDLLCDFKRIDRNRHVVKIVCTENHALTLLSASVRHCHYVTGTDPASRLIDAKIHNSMTGTRIVMLKISPTNESLQDRSGADLHDLGHQVLRFLPKKKRSTLQRLANRTGQFLGYHNAGNEKFQDVVFVAHEFKDTLSRVG